MVKHHSVVGRYVTIEVDDCEYKVFYLQNGKGIPLVCQHTAGCHNHQWRGLLEDEEIIKNYNVIAYDLPRHGKSDPPHNKEFWKEEYKLTAEHYCNFIIKLCEALDLKDPIFMGSSFGGNVALQLALRHPNKFRAVIPVEAADHAPGFYLDWWRHPHANAAQVCGSGTWDLMAPQSPERDRWLTWHYYTQGSEAFKGDLYFYSVDHDLRNELENIDCFEPCGVFYAFPNISSSGYNGQKFSDIALEEKGVALVPGTSFGNSAKNFVRVSYANSMENLDKAIYRLSTI